MKNLIDQPAWLALSQHYQDMSTQHMREWFTSQPDRFDRFSVSVGEILLDYSRNRINAETMKHLQNLATSVDLKTKIHALFSGQPINITENRAALHTALRNPDNSLLTTTITNDINQSRQHLYQFVHEIQSGKHTGITNKPFKHIVNIGIGGSYLGPKMCTEALKDFAVKPYEFHFISTVDPDHINDILENLDPETTLFIISSKTFTTIETLTNARIATAWLCAKLGDDAVAKHTVAATANKAKAMAFGIDENNIFTFDDWVGGRYSIWSAIGLPLLLMLGEAQFKQFLQGAHEIDQHFQEAPFESNIPVLLALISIWYTNFFNVTAEAIIPYSHRLRSLVDYIQQLAMESNGKSTALNDKRIPYATCPIIFGDEGCNSQHSFYQLLHQGRHLIPVDLILVLKPNRPADKAQHDIVLASALSQAYAFTQGKISQEAEHRTIDGNKPCNLIMLDRLTPHNLGALIAIYEHKIFVQGAIWNINSFDQWGVELGKSNLPIILQEMAHPDSGTFSDKSTRTLIQHFKQIREES